MKLKLPIFFYNEDTVSKDNMGIDFTNEECDVNYVTFYSIDNISPWWDGDHEYTCICSGMEKFICQMSVDEVEKKIDEQINKMPILN
jgi:hypothetical protein